jgi:UDP-GlcNAc:undecaprenyl-phosphate/decaprenyl-phosphate GlcNAc-1-phosphate transferase
MQPELSIPLALIVAAAVTWLVTPLAIRVAFATGFLDKPAGYKGHGNPTPYLGGSAIMVGVLGAGIAFGDGAGRFAVLGVCAVVLWIVGTADDKLNLSPFLRLALEIAIGVALFATGHGWTVLGSDPLDLILTVAWVVGIVNAVNLMDNMDGAAATVLGISATGTGALAILSGDPTLGALCLAVAGGCLGFLPRNLARPSRIFMGDGGSMPLGLLVAGAAMTVSSTHDLGPAGIVQAALVVGVVILDTTLVTVSRRVGGRPLLTGGRDHLTHRLRTRLGTARRVALALGGAQLLLCGMTVAVIEAHVGGMGGLLMFGTLAATYGGWAIWRLEGAPWFDAPAASLLVAETHAAAGRTPTRFVRRPDPAPAESFSS